MSHLEQAHFGGVHEQFYRVRLGQVDEAAELDGVDAKRDRNRWPYG
jgi:hypothetical protein